MLFLAFDFLRGVFVLVRFVAFVARRRSSARDAITEAEPDEFDSLSVSLAVSDVDDSLVDDPLSLSDDDSACSACLRLRLRSRRDVFRPLPDFFFFLWRVGSIR